MCLSSETEWTSNSCGCFSPLKALSSHASHGQSATYTESNAHFSRNALLMRDAVIRYYLQINNIQNQNNFPTRLLLQISVGLVQCQECGCGEMGVGQLSLTQKLDLFLPGTKSADAGKGDIRTHTVFACIDQMFSEITKRHIK